MKHVLFITSQTNINKYQEDLELFSIMSDELQKQNISVTSASFSQLSFGINNGNAFITDLKHNFDLVDFDLVVFRRIGNDKQEFSAAITYCDKKGIKRIDSRNRPLVGGKLYSAFLLWSKDISEIPKTFYGPSEHLKRFLINTGLPAIFKDIAGSRGEGNYLIQSAEDIESIVYQNSHKKFLLQEYIPNSGDYRILVLNYETVIVSHRSRLSDKTHVNNVSAGGIETYITDTSQLSREITIAKKAARVHESEIAGADIIVNNQNGNLYVMELNTAPGMTLAAEIKGYAAAISKQLGINRE